MATSYLSVRFTIPGAVETLFVSGDNLGSLQRFGNFISSLKTGSRVDAVSMVALQSAVRASGTVTFANTSVTGNTTVISGVTFTGTQLAARVRATLVSSIAGNTITVNGVVFTGTAGVVVLGAGTYSIDTSDTAAATSLAAQINAHATLTGVVTATSAAGVVTMKAVTEGTSGNALTITKSGAPITLTAQGGGADTGVFQNGAAYSGDQFDGIYNGGSVTAVAASLAAAVVRSATALVVNVVTATSALGVTTITALQPGLVGNAITLAVSGTGPSASGARLTGGTSTLVSASF